MNTEMILRMIENPDVADYVRSIFEKYPESVAELAKDLESNYIFDANSEDCDHYCEGWDGYSLFCSCGLSIPRLFYYPRAEKRTINDITFDARRGYWTTSD